MDARGDRKKLLGLLARRTRKARGYTSQLRLAEATGFAVSDDTIQAIESGRRVVSESSMNALEDFFGLPLGTMQRVLDGEIDEFPATADDGADTATDSDEARFEVGGNVYTMAELRGIAKALGPEGLYSWAMKAGTSDDASAPGAG